MAAILKMNYKSKRDIAAWRKERQERQAAEAIEIESMKIRLSRDHEIPRNSKFDKAWDIAWERGHASGLHEVEAYFDELAELLKP